MSQSCRRPDRDVPKLTCGYPLPCPWHTDAVMVVQPQGQSPDIRTRNPLPPKTVQRLDQIGRALSTPRRRKKKRR